MVSQGFIKSSSAQTIKYVLIFFAENKCKEVPDNYLTKNDSVFAFNMLKCNNSLTNNNVSFEQLGPGMLPFLFEIYMIYHNA